MAKRGRKPKKKVGRPRKDKAEAPAPKTKKRRKRKLPSVVVLHRVIVSGTTFLKAIADCADIKSAEHWVQGHGREGEIYRIGPLSVPMTVNIERLEKRSVVMAIGEAKLEVATETKATDEVQA